MVDHDPFRGQRLAHRVTANPHPDDESLDVDALSAAYEQLAGKAPDGRWKPRTLARKVAELREKTGVEAPADGTWSDEIEGDGTGEALPPADDG